MGLLMCWCGSIQHSYAQWYVQTVSDTFDYVPGKHILFEDDFKGDSVNRFPHKWEIKPFEHTSYDGTAKSKFYVQPDTGGEHEFYIGGYGNAWLVPMIGDNMAKEDTFAIEFDFRKPEGSSLELNMNDKDAQGNNTGFHRIFFNETGMFEFNSLFNGVYKAFNSQYPGTYGVDKWHHLAMSYKKQEVKFYIDEYRMFFVPACICPAPKICSVLLRTYKPVIIKNFKIATGTGNNALNGILTDSKFITHAIHFGLKASTIKPESIEFISQLAHWLKQNPTVRLEIDGHTDNVGLEAANLKLSKERAEAVKIRLVLLGIEASRLSTNGFGSSKPLQPNTTPDGKANNRRVELIKL
jgi:outer membrane protein OmpA-like peptidoglycan-associated protein